MALESPAQPCQCADMWWLRQPGNRLKESAARLKQPLLLLASPICVMPMGYGGEIALREQPGQPLGICRAHSPFSLDGGQPLGVRQGEKLSWAPSATGYNSTSISVQSARCITVISPF